MTTNKIKLTPDWENLTQIFITYPEMRPNLKDEFIQFINQILSIIYFSPTQLTIICNIGETEKIRKEITPNNEINNLTFWEIPANDIWCRDYMPFNGINDENKVLIKTVYDPSYGFNTALDNNIGMKAVYRKQGNFENIYLPIKLDGGNISTNGEYAIISDKIFSENWNYTKDEILNILNDYFETKIIIIPSETLDVIGHADSIAVFLDEKTILFPVYPDDYKVDNRYINEVYLTLTKQLPIDYQYIFLPCSLSDEISDENIFSAYGCFLNYFRIENNLILPTFKGLETELSEIKSILHKHNSQLKIYVSKADEICKDGGIFHCITAHRN